MDVLPFHECAGFTWIYRLYMDVQPLHGCTLYASISEALAYLRIRRIKISA
jgi:hypothetical protein